MIFRTNLQRELVVAQFKKAFCTDIRCRFSKGAVLKFQEIENELQFRKVSHKQIVISQTRKQRVLHTNHYASLAEYPGESKLYQSIGKDVCRHFSQ